MTALPSFKRATLFTAINLILLTTSTAYAAETNEDDSAPSTELPTVTVIADVEKADGPVKGIAASTASSITGTDESILKSVQSVTVVGQQEMQTIGAENMDQALGYSAGVNKLEAEDKTSIDYMIRGFRNFGSYRDGQKYQYNTFVGQQELYGLERIEVVKGPNSVLDGAMPPGGVINAISKKPFFDNAYEVNAEIGSFSHKKVSTDINQVLSDDVALRLVGVYQDSDSFVEYVPDDKTYIAPSLTWMPSDDTKLVLQADYQNIKTNYVYGLPPEGTVENSKQGKIPRKRFIGIPDFDNYDNDRYTIGYEVSHKLNPNLELKHNLRRMTSDFDFPITYYYAPETNKNRVYRRYVVARQDESETLTSNISAKYNWSIKENIDNVTLLGVDYTDAEHTSDRANAYATSIDLFTPDRSQDKIISPFNVPFIWNRKLKQVGFYAQNQMTWNDKLVTTVGLRHDKADLAFEYFDDANKSRSEKPENYNATTGRIGLAYLIGNGIAPYASYSQSFEPKLGVDRAGDPFEPLEGEQVEVGIRYQPEGSDTLITGSVYRIEQTNVLVKDPEDPNFNIQLGEARSQGLEIEAKTAINENLNFIAAYAYTDARTTKASPLYPEDKNKRTGNVPYNALSIWGDYRFADFGLPKLQIGAGLRYTGDTISTNNKTDVPNYTLVDAMAKYNWSDNLQFALNVKNLLDEEYLTCTYKCYYGEPRNIVGKVTYKW